MIVSRAEAQRRLGRKLKGRRHGERSFYVLSANGKKNLGGPYTKEGARRRLRQAEFFKRSKA